MISKLTDHLCKRVILIALGWPHMPWFWDVVDLSSQNTHLSPKPSQSSDSTVQWSTSQRYSQSQPSCVAPRAKAIKQGFSAQWWYELRLLKDTQPEQSVRQCGPYLLCETSQVDFRSSSIKQMANFFLHLFQEKNLQPITTDGYRSAISDKLGNVALHISKDENLNWLLDSFHRDRPKGCTGLHQTTKLPFEHLRNFFEGFVFKNDFSPCSRLWKAKE